MRTISKTAVLLIGLLLGVGWWAGGASASQVTLVEEFFSDDPVSNGRATVDGDAGRFAAGAGSLTASYNSGLSTSKLIFDLGATLDQTTSFTVEADFTIASAGFFADPDSFAQIAFGLMNTLTTGDDRAGGGPAGGDAFDSIAFDYFPNVSTLFGGPTLGPTAVSNDTDAGYFSSIAFPFGSETDLTTEGSLPLDTLMMSRLRYDAATRELLLSLSTSGGPVDINSGGGAGLLGGADGDIATIQSVLPLGFEFSVDAFALLLWEDTFRFDPGSATVIADVSFDRVLVTGDVGGQAIPEPATMAVLSGGLVVGLLRRAKRKGGT